MVEIKKRQIEMKSWLLAKAEGMLLIPSASIAHRNQETTELALCEELCFICFLGKINRSLLSNCNISTHLILLLILLEVILDLCWEVEMLYPKDTTFAA